MTISTEELKELVDLLKPGVQFQQRDFAYRHLRTLSPTLAAEVIRLREVVEVAARDFYAGWEAALASARSTPAGAGELVEAETALEWIIHPWRRTDTTHKEFRAETCRRVEVALAALSRFKEGRASSPGELAWECKARAGSHEPQDCGWPTCGCDPQANKVIEALDEGGAFTSPPPDTGSIYLSAPALSESDKRSEPVSCDGWRTMESAPKDGTRILLFATDMYGQNDPGGPRKEIKSSFWLDPSDGRGGYWANFGSHFPPTHWMPLPLPPSAANEATPRPDGSAQDQTNHNPPLRHEGDAG